EDNNGVADIIEAASNLHILTGIKGNGAGCSLMTDGGNRLDPTLVTLLLLSGAMATRRRRQSHRGKAA
ncbi:MAG: JDVT-CTERM domain-containing protein, partial [Pseudomonadota bacterium]